MVVVIAAFAASAAFYYIMGRMLWLLGRRAVAAIGMGRHAASEVDSVGAASDPGCARDAENSDHPGVSTSNRTTNSPHWLSPWVWPVGGLVLGLLIARRQYRRWHAGAQAVHADGPVLGKNAQIVSSEIVRNKLVAAYSPVLMGLNALPLTEHPVDGSALLHEYRRMRPLIYEHSDLLSRQIMQAASRADECLEDVDHGRLTVRLLLLRKLVRKEHDLLKRRLDGS